MDAVGTVCRTRIALARHNCYRYNLVRLPLSRFPPDDVGLLGCFGYVDNTLYALGPEFLHIHHAQITVVHGIDALILLRCAVPVIRESHIAQVGKHWFFRPVNMP